MPRQDGACSAGGACVPSDGDPPDRQSSHPNLKSADEILASVKRFCQRTQQTLCAEL